MSFLSLFFFGWISHGDNEQYVECIYNEYSLSKHYPILWSIPTARLCLPIATNHFYIMMLICDMLRQMCMCLCTWFVHVFGDSDGAVVVLNYYRGDFEFSFIFELVFLVPNK